MYYLLFALHYYKTGIHNTRPRARSSAIDFTQLGYWKCPNWVKSIADDPAPTIGTYVSQPDTFLFFVNIPIFLYY